MKSTLILVGTISAVMAGIIGFGSGAILTLPNRAETQKQIDQAKVELDAVTEAKEKIEGELAEAQIKLATIAEELERVQAAINKLVTELRKAQTEHAEKLAKAKAEADKRLGEAENFKTIDIKEKSARAKLVDKEVAEIMKGKYGKLPPMQKISSGGRRQYSAINIHNDTRYNLTVRYSGPDSCKVTFTPKKKGCVQVLNGNYKVAASVDAARVTDYAGTAKLDGGNFEVTYYISTTGPYGVNIPRISPPRIYYGGAPAFKPWPMKRSVSQ